MDGMQRLVETEAAARLRSHDASLYTTDYDKRGHVMQRLGWTDLAEKAPSRFALLENLRSQLAELGIKDIVLLGMGGSSLAPLVLSEILGSAHGERRLHVLDTTCPRTVAAAMDALDPQTTAFILASKSGTTGEPLALYAIFRAWAEQSMSRKDAGQRFVVVTDPGSPLEKLRQRDLLRIVLNGVPTVGGRFSALSMFGLAPAALVGIDLPSLVEPARAMELACGTPPMDNPGAELAAWIYDAHERGNDKLTLVCTERLAPFGLWVEQLVAESTGKDSLGVVPVLEDPSSDPSTFGEGRAVVVLRLREDTALADWGGRARTGRPYFEIVLDDVTEIGAEFVRWEYAVALLGYLLGINPFDEPNVAEAKKATGEILSGALRAPEAVADVGGVWITLAGALAAQWPGSGGVETALRAALDTMYGPDYLAVLAFLPQEEALLEPLRKAMIDVSRLRGNAACLEVGPRYLHSTGQLHKGGPDTGVFVLVTTRDTVDLPVPGAHHTLQMYYRAQAEGDLVTLAAHGRRVVRLDLPAPTPQAVATLADALRAAAVR